MTKYHMSWAEYTEMYGERPEEHYDDPADYQDAIGNHHIAKAIRARRRKEKEDD